MNMKGFSLIELMITVAIVGILAGIAYPSLQDSVRQSKRTDAYASIMNIKLKQENLRRNCRFYAGTLASADSCQGSSEASSIQASSSSHDGFYSLAVSLTSGNAYTITASAVGDQANDTACSSIVLTVNASNSDGIQSPDKCW